MITGILLAAGKSSRFGNHKLLHPLPNGNPIGVTAAQNLLAVLPNSIAIVRPGDQLLTNQLAATGIRIVVNEHAGSGMGSSLACGISTTSTAKGWIIALADMPFIQTSSILAVATVMKNKETIAVPSHLGKQGHPVGFGKGYQSQLSQLCGDRGARRIIQQNRKQVRIVEVDDPGILTDIDSPLGLPRHLSHPDNQEPENCKPA